MSLTAAELRAVYSVDEGPLDRSLNGLGGKVRGAVGGAVAAAAGLFAFGKISDGFFSLTGAASDLNETVNKSSVIFGSNAAAIDQWASGAAKNLGMSRQQALDAAAGFGDMFSQIGFAGDQAAAMSTKVVQMSADLGSFNNLGTDDVAQRISAAFRGEYDSLQALIPNINAARVESEALAMTGKKNADSLTAQEKAAAVLAIVQKDGARAMGDFAKTSDGAANSTKIATAQWEDQKAAIGQRLLPVLTAMLGFISGTVIPAVGKLADFIGDRAVPALQDMAESVGSYVLPKLQELWSVFNARVLPVLEDIGRFITGTLVPALQDLGGFIGDHATLFESLAVGVGTAYAAFKIYQAGLAIWAAVTKGYAAVQAALNAVMAMNPIGLVVLAIAALVGGLIYAYKHSETFRDIVNGAFDAVKRGVGNAIGFMIDGFRMLLTVWLTVADGIISGAATALGWIPGLGDKLKAANTAFDNMKDGILSTLDEAAQKAYGFGEKSGSNAAKGLDSTKQGAFNAGKQVGDDMGRGVGAGSGTAYNAGYGVGDNAAQGLINGMKARELAVARQAQILAITAGRAMQTGLQEKSPSRWTMWMGEMLGEGLVIGIERSEASVVAAMSGLTGHMRMATVPQPATFGVRTPVMAGVGAGAGGASGAGGITGPLVNIEEYHEQPGSSPASNAAALGVEFRTRPWT